MTSNTPGLQDQISAALGSNPARVFQLDSGGKTYWVKRPETRNLFSRLQKGSAAKTFEAERFALHYLGARGAPVSPVVAEGEDFLVTEHQGTPIVRLLERADLSSSDKARIFSEAARALARLHARSLSHGRPNLKDICWDGERISFIDFERFALTRNAPKGHAQDIILFLLSAYSMTGETTPEIDAAVAAYRKLAPAPIWQLAEKWCRRHRWIYWISRPFSRLRPNSAELRALPLTFRTFGAIR